MFKHHHFHSKDHLEIIWKSDIQSAYFLAIIKGISKGYREGSNTYLTWFQKEKPQAPIKS